MKGVGPQDVLGFLLDVAGCVRGEEFRAHRGVQDIPQHLSGVAQQFRPGDIVHHPADHRLGDADVDVVVGNMIPGKGAPPQGLLRKVAGAHHQAAYRISQIQKDLGPLPGLGIFIGGVLFGRIVADILKVLEDRRLDGDIPAGCPQVLDEGEGVEVGAVAGAKAGHGNRHHVLPGEIQGVGCRGRDQQG